MLALERQKKIMDLLDRDGAVLVSKLSTELGVTEETIRRDLEKLEKQDMLRRTHGGAVQFDENAYDLSLETRKSKNVDDKKNLAKAAARFIASGDTIFLDASTTTFFIAKEIKSIHNLTFINNSVRILSELAGSDTVKVIAIGGVVSQNQSLVGNMAEQCIDNYFANKMFFSSKGLTPQAGILDSNAEESGIKKKMMHNCSNIYYLCDSSKIGRVGFIKLANFADIDGFITEADVDDALREKLTEAEVEIVIA